MAENVYKGVFYYPFCGCGCDCTVEEVDEGRVTRYHKEAWEHASYYRQQMVTQHIDQLKRHDQLLAARRKKEAEVEAKRKEAEAAARKAAKEAAEREAEKKARAKERRQRKAAERAARKALEAEHHAALSEAIGRNIVAELLVKPQEQIMLEEVISEHARKR